MCAAGVAGAKSFQTEGKYRQKANNCLNFSMFFRNIFLTYRAIEASSVPFIKHNDGFLKSYVMGKEKI